MAPKLNILLLHTGGTIAMLQGLITGTLGPPKPPCNEQKQYHNYMILPILMWKY
jgi:L-asparaginase/Glu-tRNA(Gln) amidotransferase subunit D